MRSVYERAVSEQTEIQRNLMQGTARLCSGSKFGVVCKALWPFKTAEELAARAGCAVRTAAYQISGERPPTSRAIAAVIAEMLD